RLLRIEQDALIAAGIVEDARADDLAVARVHDDGAHGVGSVVHADGVRAGCQFPTPNFQLPTNSQLPTPKNLQRRKPKRNPTLAIGRWALGVNWELGVGYLGIDTARSSADQDGRHDIEHIGTRTSAPSLVELRLEREDADGLQREVGEVDHAPLDRARRIFT